MRFPRIQPFELLKNLLSKSDGIEFGRFLILIFQLAVLVLIVRLFRVEDMRGFWLFSLVILFGFMIHTYLPFRFKLPFFFLLTLLSIGFIFGFPAGLYLILLGLAFIGLSHLPVSLYIRILLIVTLGGIMAAFRADWIHTTWSGAVLPILGSIFMFRLIIYLYDIRHEKKPVSVWHRLTYFFMLPNVYFPMFPVVDYKTSLLTYYNEKPHLIYQKGVHWIVRGVTHLLLYRLIYYHFLPSPAEVYNLGTLALFMVTNYMLYLRISGLFHLIAGILCLFGFNLPETHHQYFLASGFNDFWRRINIYWKDFMMKIFYYPFFMKFRRWGITTALVLATLIVFMGTWILHSYQWFWLRGSFPITAVDGLFWGILGVLVVGNSLIEAKRGRKRSLGQATFSVRAALKLSVKTVAMFMFMCGLWSFWSSTSVSEWVSIVATASNSPLSDFLWIPAVVSVLIAIGVVIQYLSDKGITLPGEKAFSFSNSVVLTGSTLLVLLIIGQPEVSSQLGSPMSEYVQSLKEDRFNQKDEELFERGYYETLLESDRYLSPLWQVQVEKPADWKPLKATPALRQVGGILGFELVPTVQAVFKRALLQTNRWGMRDRDYSLQKPPGVYRIALLGASYVMGSGVENNHTFDSVLEDLLNKEKAGGAPERYEVLNFAVGGYTLYQHIWVLEHKLPQFDVDAVFYITHLSEARWSIAKFIEYIKEGIQFPDTFFARLEAQTGIEPEMTATEIRRRLKPLGDEVFLRWGYRRIVEFCRQHGMKPVWVFLPTTDGIFNNDRYQRLLHTAEEAGFTTISLNGVYGKLNRKLIRLAPWDKHPNAEGHRLIAQKLFKLLEEKNSELKLSLKNDPKNK